MLIRLAALSICVVIAKYGSFAFAENCKPLKFRPGGDSAVVQGIAPPAEHDAAEVCYEIATRSGQHASVRLLPGSGKNVIFGIDGVVDPGENKNAGDESHTFSTENRSYKIRVMQLLTRQGDQPFKLSVTIK